MKELKEMDMAELISLSGMVTTAIVDLSQRIGSKTAFEEGSCKAWGLARLISDMSCEECQQIFNEWNLDNVLKEFTYEGASERLKAHDMRTEINKLTEVVVGDEIIFVPTNSKSVVTKIDDLYRCLDGVGYPKEDCKKTGRHFVEIEKVLDRMEE